MAVPEKTIFSCVMDRGPSFLYQTRLWVDSLFAAGASPSDIVVHALDRCSTREREAIRRLGVEVLSVAPFDAAHPYSNKLAQLASPAFESADHVVLCDCDLAFAGPLDGLIAGDGVRAKPVDTATPSPEIWRRIFARYGFAEPTFDSISTWSRMPTIWNNLNGGIYVFPPAELQRLGEPWRRWDRRLIAEPEALEGMHMFIDQVAFALACEEIGVRVDHLPLRFNTPTHLEVKPDTLVGEEPVVLHHHGKIDRGGFLISTGDPLIDRAVAKVNDRIGEARRAGFDNHSFWEFRYAQFPEAGSGVGSRGETLRLKARLLKEQVRAIRPASLLDVGCGDLEVSRRLPVRNYYGVDVSEEAVAIARKKRRSWRFAAGDFLTLPVKPADLVVCLDVLIHQPTRDEYEAFCRRLLELTGQALLVGAYNQPPWHTSELTFFYEPISQTIQRLQPDARLEIVGGYRDTTMLRVVLPVTKG